MSGQSKGFTLYEVLVAVAILGILTLVSFVGVAAQFKKARDGKRKADLETIKIALYE